MPSRTSTKVTKRIRARARTKGAAPKVAIDRAAKARRKILAGINALKRVRTPDVARHAIDRKWPTSVGAFVDWKRIGGDTLYATNQDLLDDVRTYTKRLAALAKRSMRESKPRPPRRAGELARVKKELAEQRALLVARDLDILRMSEEIEKERRDKIFYMRRFEEVRSK